MIRKISLAIIAVVGILVFTNAAMAQNETSFGYEASRSGSTVKFRATTHVNADNLWLLVTIYPPKEVVGETIYKTFAIKKGKDVQDVTLDAKYKNGTFEASIYGKKLLKGKDCLATDQLCQSVGYRLSNMALYVWGYINAQ